MRKFALPAIFVLAVCLSSCSKQSVTTQPNSNRRAAADFALSDSNGATVKLSDYKGKVVLLNFWATWCGPCQTEIPWFKEFEQQYKAQGFAVLGVSMDEDGWGAVKPYINDHKVNYRILLGNDSVTQLYGGVESLPTSYVIDRAGRVAFPPHVGLISKGEYANEIQTLLSDTQRSALPADGALLASLHASPAK